MATVQNQTSPLTLDRPARILGEPGFYLNNPDKIPQGYQVGPNNRDLILIEEEAAPVVETKPVVEAAPIPAEQQRVTVEDAEPVLAVEPVPVSAEQVGLTVEDAGEAVVEPQKPEAPKGSAQNSNVTGEQLYNYISAITTQKNGLDELNTAINDMSLGFVNINGVDQPLDPTVSDVRMYQQKGREELATLQAKENLTLQEQERLQALRTDELAGVKWHFGIPLMEWLNADNETDPRDRFAAKRNLLRQRLVELGQGKGENGEDVLTGTYVQSNFDPNTIGWSDTRGFYKNLTYLENVTMELLKTGQLTARGIIKGIPDLMLAVNEIGGYALVGMGLGPAAAFEEAERGILSLFDDYLKLSEEEKRPAVQRFMRSLEYVGVSNEQFREYLDDLYVDWGFHDHLGEQYSGNLLQNSIEDFIPWVLASNPITLMASEVATAAKAYRLGRRAFRDEGYIPTGYNKALHLELLQKRNTGKYLNSSQRAQLNNLNALGKEMKLAGPGSRELSAREKWWRLEHPPQYPFKNGIPIMQSALSDAAKTKILVFNTAAEAGASAGMFYAKEAFGEDSPLGFITTLLGAVSGIGIVRGVPVDMVANKSLYSLDYMTFLSSRIGPETPEKVAAGNISLIKMFNLEEQARKMERDKFYFLQSSRIKEKYSAELAQGLAASRGRREFEGPMPGRWNEDAAINSIIQTEQAELRTLRNKNLEGSITPGEQKKLQELETAYPDIDITDNSWENNLTLSETSSIISTRPKEMKKLIKVANYILHEDNISDPEKAQLREKIDQAKEVAGMIEVTLKDDPIWKELGIKSGEESMKLFLSYFIRSSVLEFLQKDIQKKILGGTALNLASRMRLFTKYHTFQLEKERNVELLKRFTELHVRPFADDIGRMPQEYDNFMNVMRNHVDSIEKSTSENFTLIKEQLGELHPQIKKWMDDDALQNMDRITAEIENVFNVTGMENRHSARASVQLANIATAVAYKDTVEPSGEAYTRLGRLIQELQDSGEFNVSIAAVAKDILEDAGDESVISYIKLEQAAGRVPNSKRVIDIVVNGRRETLRRLLQIDTEANKIGDSQYLFDLVREMIRTGDGATPENGPTFKIIDDSQPSGYREVRPVSRKRVSEVSSELDEIEQDVLEEIITREQADEKRVSLINNWIEDIIHIPSDKIPVEIPFDLISEIRSNATGLAFQHRGEKRGFRYGKVVKQIDILDEEAAKALDANIDIVTDADGNVIDTKGYLTPAQAIAWTQKKLADEEYKKLMDELKEHKSFWDFATKEGPGGQTTVYSYEKDKIIDEAGNVLSDKISNHNSFEYFLRSDVPPDNLAENFVRAFGDANGVVKPEIISVLNDTIGMALIRGETLPAGWWNSFREVYEKSGKGSDYLDSIMAIMDDPEWSPLVQRQGTLRKGKEAGKAAEKALEDEKERVGRVINNAQNKLSELQKKMEDRRKHTYIGTILELLDPRQGGLTAQERIEILFGKQPNYKRITSDIPPVTGRELDSVKQAGILGAQNNQEALARLIDPEATDARDIIENISALSPKGVAQEPPIVSVLRMIEESGMSQQQREGTVDAIRDLFGEFMIDSIWKKQQEKATISKNLLVETVDFKEAARFLSEYRPVWDHLYSKQQKDNLDLAFGLLGEIAVPPQNLGRALNLPTELRMESYLAQGFALVRRVVSLKWLIAAASVRQMRDSSANMLLDFVADPSQITAVRAVLNQDPKNITKLDKDLMFKIFARFLPKEAVDEISTKHFQEQIRQSQEDTQDVKRILGLPEDYDQRRIPTSSYPVTSVRAQRQQLEALLSERPELIQEQFLQEENFKNLPVWIQSSLARSAYPLSEEKGQYGAGSLAGREKRIVEKLGAAATKRQDERQAQSEQRRRLENVRILQQLEALGLISPSDVNLPASIGN